MEPVRIQRSRAKGARLISPNGLPVVCVTRPGVFGNPFSGKSAVMFGLAATEAEGKEVAVHAFRDFLENGHKWGKAIASVRERLLSRLPELRGKNLACWCGPNDACHADVLLEIANAPAPQSEETR